MDANTLTVGEGHDLLLRDLRMLKREGWTLCSVYVRDACIDRVYEWYVHFLVAEYTRPQKHICDRTRVVTRVEYGPYDSDEDRSDLHRIAKEITQARGLCSNEDYSE